MNTRVKYHIIGFRLIIGYLENAPNDGIYSLHGLELRLLSPQEIGVFRYFRWFLDNSKSY